MHNILKRVSGEYWVHRPCAIAIIICRVQIIPLYIRAHRVDGHASDACVYDINIVARAVSQHTI